MKTMKKIADLMNEALA